jgi:hypothetical protein
MSDHYFASARAAGCTGLKDGMEGFHACARDAGASKYATGPKKKKRPKGQKKITKYFKKKASDPLDDDPGLNDIIAKMSQPNFFGKGKKKVKGGCGTCTPWITHVKAYQSKHGCSYKEALSQASKTYHK